MVAARMSTDDIRLAISETRAYSHQCKQGVNIPKVFTSRIKDIAGRRGVSLKAVKS
jgi:hypothetical protein